MKKVLLVILVACIAAYFYYEQPQLVDSDFFSADNWKSGVEDILGRDVFDDDLYGIDEQIGGHIPSDITQTTTAKVTKPAAKKTTTTKKSVTDTSKPPAATTTTVTAAPAPVTTLPQEGGPLGFYDDRVPDYMPTSSPDYISKTFSWGSYDGRYNFTITLSIDRHMYEYYHSLTRYYDLADFKNYIDDQNNAEIVKCVADQLRDLAQKCDYSQSELVQETVNFVQNITYRYDSDTTGEREFPRYPLETIYDQCGDCEDSSILLAAFLKELGYGNVLIAYDDHVAVGIQGEGSLSGSYFEYEGVRYYYIETTNRGWDIGHMPDEYRGTSAKIYRIY